jgi:hypothetical protein
MILPEQSKVLVVPSQITAGGGLSIVWVRDSFSMTDIRVTRTMTTLKKTFLILLNYVW